MHLEPCPFCDGVSINLNTGPGDNRAYGECYGCGARGPTAPFLDQRPWDVAAAEEWNCWSLARRHGVMLAADGTTVDFVRLSPTP